ncbi:uncharacterized protein LOC134264029 [Saccostrea cucullata]|uniref:uncharacterized protein LOC134264029 n=1 Tax=Saccostrea cuccullata TaxID=36930 RepID=UPI002ED4E683
MPGYYGNLCLLPCECYAHQCDPESGCPGTISPIQEEQNNTSTWTLVFVIIIGSVATLLVSCICLYLWISKRGKPRLRYPKTNPTDLDDTLTATVKDVNTCKQSPDHAEICDSLNSSLSQSKDGDLTATEIDVKCKHEIEYVEKEDKYGGLHDSEYHRLQFKTNRSLRRQYIGREDKDSEEFVALERVEFSGVNTEDRIYSIPQMSQNENQWANRSQIDSLCTSEYSILSIDNISPKTFPNSKEMPSITIENELKGNSIMVGEPQYSLVKFSDIEIEDDRNKSVESQTTPL